MRKGTQYSLLTIVAMVFLLSAIMQAQQKLAQTGLQFLEIGLSPRAEAMGGAFVLAGDKADALFYNPAGIAKGSPSYDIVLNRVQWFADMNYNAIGATYQPSSGEYGVIGLSFLTADYGDFYGTRVAAGTPEGYEDIGMFTPTAYAVGLSYAKEITDKFTIGGQAKYVSQALGSNMLTAGGSQKENSVSGYSFDFGMMYSTAIKGFDFGMSIKNFAADFKYEQYSFEAPLTFRVGVSLRPFELLGMPDPDNDLLIVADAVHPRDFGEHLDLGAEYTLSKMVSFRVGYKVNYSEQDLTAGLGFNYSVLSDVNVRMDYAYGRFGLWNNVQRLALGFTMF
ncbi:MAG: PorV/PorQ family protein [Bacteroidota bacterium]